MWNPIQKIQTAYHETLVELKKCTWPSWNELSESTVVVVVSVAILSIFVASADWVAQAVVQLLTVKL